MIHNKAAIGFDRAGDQYDRGRPEYPQDAVDFIISKTETNSSKTILDLGAGTGKFTRLLAPSKANIIAVEPVEGMRQKFIALLPNMRLLPGTAEKIPLENGTVDTVVIAQAFHWFDGPAALAEIHRVLKKDGYIGLIWNVRDESLDWVKELTKIIDPHEDGAPRYKTMSWKKAFDACNFFSKLQISHFRYIQECTVDTILDRVGSISFISSLHNEAQKEVLNEVRRLIENHPETKSHPTINLPYRTDVYWCKKITLQD